LQPGHLFQRQLIQRAGHLQALRLLILLEAGACRIVEFASLFAAVKVPLFQQHLSLINLLFRCPKNRAAIRVGVLGLIGICVLVRAGN
jgi:hypothetical protein